MNKGTQKIISLICALVLSALSYAGKNVNKSSQTSAGCMSCHQSGVSSANNPKNQEKPATTISNKSADAH